MRQHWELCGSPGGFLHSWATAPKALRQLRGLCRGSYLRGSTEGFLHSFATTLRALRHRWRLSAQLYASLGSFATALKAFFTALRPHLELGDNTGGIPLHPGDSTGNSAGALKASQLGDHTGSSGTAGGFVVTPAFATVGRLPLQLCDSTEGVAAALGASQP